MHTEDDTLAREDFMKSVLIFLRGNSASGKSTTAKLLQKHFREGTLLVSQDMFRIKMLNVRDTPANLSHDLIRQIVEYGKGKCRYVILEGILNTGRYGDMLKELIHYFDNRTHMYYFDLTLEETIKRHNTRDKKYDFGEDSLRAWFVPHDRLRVADEKVFTDETTQEEILGTVLRDVRLASSRKICQDGF